MPPSPNQDRLTLTELSGSARSAGCEYGRLFETVIVGFCHQELTPDEDRLDYARRCLPHVEKHAPESAFFMHGTAEGADLAIEHVVLTSLHEEIFLLDKHHCTAFAARDAAVCGGGPLVGMNWDWNSNCYPWPGLLRLDVDDWPRMATYHYPGLWASAGINEDGMALMWTGAGHFPKRMELTDGVPTYVLISEILRRTSVEEALGFLDGVSFAGAFIFFLGDARGDTALVEGFPGHMTAVRDADTVTRANHFECDAAREAAHQEVSRSPASTTLYRADRMRELVREHYGHLDVPAGQRILTDRDGVWPWLHQYPDRRGAHGISLRAMTMDSLLADCESRTLYTCRGGRKHGPWQRIDVA